MQFLFLYRSSPDPRDQPSPAEMQEGYGKWKSWMTKYAKEILEQPAARSGPKPGGAAAVCRAGAVTDGPFVEGKEHIGGFTVIKASDLDEALEWGRRFARITTLPIEVRPFQGDVED